MFDKLWALIENYLNRCGIYPILIAIPFFVGLVYLFISGKRMRGLRRMVCSLLCSCVLYMLVYNYIHIKGIIMFAVMMVPLSIIGWVKSHKFSAEKCVTILIVYPIVIAGLLAVAALIEKQEILPFIQAITSEEWMYILFFACVGIWVMPYILKIFTILYLLADCVNPSAYSSQDGAAGATGDEQSVDTVSMSMFDD